MYDSMTIICNRLHDTVLDSEWRVINFACLVYMWQYCWPVL